MLSLNASKPGSAYLYPNLSYRILGAVIEKASGESHVDFLRKHTLSPLDMTQTGPTDRRESYQTLDARLGGRDPRAAEARRRLATLYQSWGRPEQAAQCRAPP